MTTNDVITMSFGDTVRMYMRGQMTIVRNTEWMNMLWRKCTYLTDITGRLRMYSKEVASGRASGSWTAGWYFLSAEGCFSRVVSDEPNITMTVKAIQLSDAFGAPTREKRSLLLGSSLIRCYKAPLLESDELSKYVMEYPKRLISYLLILIIDSIL